MILSRMLYCENDVRIFSTISTAGYVDKKGDNPMYIDMGTVRINLVFKLKKAVFRITPSNKPRVDRFFDTVNNWFRDPTMNDLFVYNAFSKLVFNQKYGQLKRIVYSGNDTHQFMEAVPVVLENLDGKDVEGVMISIDSHSNAITLTIDEFDSICDIIKDFSFQSEIIFGYFRYLKIPKEEKVRRTERFKCTPNPFV